jgi:hypothetical protein
MAQPNIVYCRRTVKGLLYMALNTFLRGGNGSVLRTLRAIRRRVLPRQRPDGGRFISG